MSRRLLVAVAAAPLAGPAIVSPHHPRNAHSTSSAVAPLMAYTVDWFFSTRGRRAVAMAVGSAAVVDADLASAPGDASPGRPRGRRSGASVAAGPGGGSGGGGVRGAVARRRRRALRAAADKGSADGEGPGSRSGAGPGAAPELGWGANGRVVMNCVPEDDSFRLVATRDPADRAHRQRMMVKDERGGQLELYRPAADDRGRPAHNLSATPRRYDRSQITSRGVAFDSAFDSLREAQDRLAGVSGVGIQAQVTIAEARNRALAQLAARTPEHRVRRLIERPLHVDDVGTKTRKGGRRCSL